MSVHGRPIGKNYHVPARHPANHHVAISRTNENATGEEEIAGTRFVNFKSAAFVEALGEHFGKALGHVLNDQNGRKKIRGNLRQNKLQGVGTAGGNSDGDDAARRQRGASPFFRRGGFHDDGGRKLAAGGALGDFYFGDELAGDFIEAAGGGVFWLGEKINSAEREGLKGGVTALFRMSAEKNDGQRSAAHDEAQSFSAIHGGADNFDGRFARENRGDQFPHKSGIINDENTNAFTHAMAPRGVERTKRERTAGTFRIITTLRPP